MAFVKLKSSNLTNKEKMGETPFSRVMSIDSTRRSHSAPLLGAHEFEVPQTQLWSPWVPNSIKTQLNDIELNVLNNSMCHYVKNPQQTWWHSYAFQHCLFTHTFAHRCCCKDTLSAATHINNTTTLNSQTFKPARRDCNCCAGASISPATSSQTASRHTLLN